MSDVFISYSHYDSADAVALAEYLRTEGVDVWIDQHSIEAADQWGKQIVEAIDACSTFVLMLSPQSVASHNVLKEVMLASERRKRILPIELHPTILPTAFEYPLAGIHRMVNTTPEDAARAIQGLTVPGQSIHGRATRLHRTEATAGGSAAAKKSLMILPFEDLSPSQDNRWFAEGLMSDLITSLSHINALRLIDEKTARECRSSNLDLYQLARELNVRYFLEGTVRKYGEQIKISVQLLDVEEGEYLWADSHKGVFSDIFDIQEAVARKVVEGLTLTLSVKEQGTLSKRGTANSEAYELKLRATEYLSRQTREGYVLGSELSRKAIELDPTYYDACYELAHTLVSLYLYDQDPTQLDEAEQLVQRAGMLSHTRYDHLSVLARIEALRKHPERAESIALEYTRLTPDNYHSWSSLGYVYYLTQEPAKAIPAWIKTIELNPDELIAHCNLAACYDRTGDAMGAKRAALNGIPRIEHALRVRPDDSSLRIRLANMYRYAALNEQALKTLGPVAERPDIDCTSLYNIACLHAVLGASDTAMHLLRRALESGFAETFILQSDPDLHSLRGRQDFSDLLAHVGHDGARSVAA